VEICFGSEFRCSWNERLTFGSIKNDVTMFIRFFDPPPYTGSNLIILLGPYLDAYLYQVKYAPKSLRLSLNIKIFYFPFLHYSIDTKTVFF